jgi:homopolymeric O-antigen transport system permease protein
MHTEKKQGWDLEITHKTKLLAFHLNDIWKYRDLLMLLVKRDFVAQYKQTVLGPLWHLIQPIFTSLIFVLIFGKIANIPTNGIPPILFYLSALTMWNYFSVCLVNTSSTFISNAHIFGKVYFPRLIIPLSVVLSNIIRFGIQFFLLLLLIVYYHLTSYQIHFGYALLLVPVILLIMAGLGLGLGIIVSSLTTKYRDLAVFMTFGVQLLMYATPVAYPLSYIENFPNLRWLKFNPLSPLIESFRYSLFGTGTLDFNGILYSGTVMLICLFGGLVVFNRVEKSFMDTV